jgi:hypothetical protein
MAIKVKEKAIVHPKIFTFKEKFSLPKCKEITEILHNPAIENFPIYVVDNKGNHIKIKTIAYGENFDSVEISLY